MKKTDSEAAGRCPTHYKEINFLSSDPENVGLNYDPDHIWRRYDPRFYHYN